MTVFLPASRLAALVLLVVILIVSAAYGQCPQGDLDNDCRIDLQDLAILAEHWMTQNLRAQIDDEAEVNLGDLQILASNWLREGSTLIISEFLASNGNIDFDEDGDSSDWIEIFNPTATTVSLDGWYLTDNPNDPAKWRFGTIELGAGEYLVVFASSKDRRDPAGELHANFQLSASGGYLALVKPDGKSIAWSFGPEYPRQYENVSYGISQLTNSLTLVSRTSGAKLLVPQSAAELSADWYDVDFADESWDNAVVGVGFDTSAGGSQEVTNVALGKPTWQSSTLSGYVSELAVDGLTSNFTHTLNTDSDATWQVDLEGSYYISKIVLRNRYGCCQSRLRDITVSIRDSENTADIYVSSLLNPEDILVSPEFITVDLIQEAGSAAYGGIVRVHRTPDQDLSGTDGAGNDDEKTVLSLSEVEVFASELPNAYSEIIETDIFDSMAGKNASAYVRIPFELSDTSAYNLLNMKIRYDDGFVAYLNGTKVASRNAPDALQWDSAALSERQKDQAVIAETVNLTEFVHLLRQGHNTLAIQGLNHDVGDGDFLLDVELVASANMVKQIQFMDEPSMGTDNNKGFPGIVADTKFSHDRGFYDHEFDVEITTETDGAAIYYTTDASMPSATNGTMYTGPVHVATTTCLRAVAVKTDWLPTNVDTQTYIFPNDVINQPSNPSGFPSSWNGTAADYEMDRDITTDQRYLSRMRESLLSLPTMSIVTENNNLFDSSYGIYSNPTQHVSELSDGSLMWEVPASVEYFDPNSDRQFQIDCGLRIQGGYFRSSGATRKHSFRLLFKRMYGPTKLEFPLFDYDEDAVDRFDTIILRAGANDGYSWNAAQYTEQYTRDQFGRSLQLATGNAASHGIFVHLYVNGLYWGLYNPVERPDSSFCASYYGGQKENWDSLKTAMEVLNGSINKWNEMISKCQQAAGSDAAYQELQGNDPDGDANPDYPRLLDVPGYVDYLIINLWGGNWDWPWKNFYMARQQGPESTGYEFFCWDYENTMGNNLDRSPLNKNALNNSFTGVGVPHTHLRQNAEYRMLFADHIHRYFFNGGILTPDLLIARYTELAAGVEKAIISESARWGDQAHHPPLTLDDWYDADKSHAGRDWILEYYLPQRSDVVLQQFKDASLYPSLSAPCFKVNGSYKHGGYASNNSLLSMYMPDDVSYVDVELVGESVPVRVHFPTDNSLGDTWTDRTYVPDSGWSDGSTVTGVGYERGSGYEDWISTDVESQMYGKGTSVLCRIEFQYDASQPLDRLELRMKYDDGFVAYINGVQVCKSTNVTSDIPGNTAISTGHEAGVSYETFPINEYRHLLVSGTNVLAIHGINTGPTSSDMLVFPVLAGRIEDANPISKPIWYATDGSDPRLSGGSRNPYANQYSSAVTLDKSMHVKARTRDNGQWSALNEAVYAVGPVRENLRITEILYNPADPNTEFIELENIGTETINLNLVRFTNGVDFEFGDVSLAGGKYVLIVENLSEFVKRYDTAGMTIAGEYTGNLDNGGENIELVDAIGSTILEFGYKDGWYDLTDGFGFSLTIRDPFQNPLLWDQKEGWRASVYEGGTPGEGAVSVLATGSIVINEVLAHSHGTLPDWIELHNTTGQNINIGGWFLSDNNSGDLNIMKYEIPAGTVIKAKDSPNNDDYVVFVEDVGQPGSNYFPFGLSEAGETVYLTSGEAGQITGYYKTEENFDASETDQTFGRYEKTELTGGYDFTRMLSSTPKTANSGPLIPDIVITEIHYNPPEGKAHEFVELYNRSGSPVTLMSPADRYTSPTTFVTEDVPWRLEGTGYEFPASTTIPAGGRLIVAKAPSVYGGPSSSVLGPYTGSLDNDGEQLELQIPGDWEYGKPKRYWIPIEKIDYGVTAPWATTPNGGGDSLHRINVNTYGRDYSNWKADTQSPGR